LAYIPITIFLTLIAALVISLTINSALYYKLSKSKTYFEDAEVNRKYMRKSDQAMLIEDRKGKEEKPIGIKSIREKFLDRFADAYSTFI
jgi:hypothetical protein